VHVLSGKKPHGSQRAWDPKVLALTWKLRSLVTRDGKGGQKNAAVPV
jgi:hypothetical protein